MEYKVWKANKFNDDILTDLVAIFYDLEIAVDYVKYQATISEHYVIIQNGTKVDIY
mgnify:CR=1 FL=1